MMDGNLFILLGGLMLLLLILVVVYVLSDAKKSSKSMPASEGSTTSPQVSSGRKPPKERPTFDTLEGVVLDRNSSKGDLAEAVALIGRYYGTIHATTIQRYIRIIVTLCRHPQTSKEIIIALDRALQAANPNWRPELDAALKKGLESRL